MVEVKGLNTELWSHSWYWFLTQNSLSAIDPFGKGGWWIACEALLGWPWTKYIYIKYFLVDIRHTFEMAQMKSFSYCLVFLAEVIVLALSLIPHICHISCRDVVVVRHSALKSPWQLPTDDKGFSYVKMYSYFSGVLYEQSVLMVEVVWSSCVRWNRRWMCLSTVSMYFYISAVYIGNLVGYGSCSIMVGLLNIRPNCLYHIVFRLPLVNQYYLSWCLFTLQACTL